MLSGYRPARTVKGMVLVLQQADTTLTVYRDAIALIADLLASPSPDQAKLSAIGQVIAERLPPPAVSLHWPPARLAPGSTWGEAAGQIAAHLSWNAGQPASCLLAEFAGTTLVPAFSEPVMAKVDDDDTARLLDAAAGDQLYERTGAFYAGRAVVAYTRLVLLSDRLPGEAWAAIWDGRPCGEVLHPYGMRRRCRAEATGGDPAVVSSAVLSIGGRPVGLSAEHIPAAFCQRLARLANTSDRQTQPGGE
jgi:hypothetical protein